MKSLGARSFIRGRQGARGFTLLEVMLAFVIFALSFATVLEILAGSMRSVRRASDDTEVALMAQSLIDLVGTEIPIEEGQYSGNSMDRYDWNMEITLYDSGGETGDNTEVEGMSTQELADLSGIELYRVDLYVDWETGRRQRELHFSTIRSILANRL